LLRRQQLLVVVRVPAQAARALVHLGQRGGEELAHLQRGQPRHLLAPAREYLGRAAQQPGAAGGRLAPPGQERALGELQLAVELMVAERLEAGERLLGRRVDRCDAHGAILCPASRRVALAGSLGGWPPATRRRSPSSCRNSTAASAAERSSAT